MKRRVVVPEILREQWFELFQPYSKFKRALEKPLTDRGFDLDLRYCEIDANTDPDKETQILIDKLPLTFDYWQSLCNPDASWNKMWLFLANTLKIASASCIETLEDDHPLMMFGPVKADRFFRKELNKQIENDRENKLTKATGIAKFYLSYNIESETAFFTLRCLTTLSTIWIVLPLQFNPIFYLTIPIIIASNKTKLFLESNPYITNPLDAYTAQFKKYFIFPPGVSENSFTDFTELSKEWDRTCNRRPDIFEINENSNEQLPVEVIQKILTHHAEDIIYLETGGLKRNNSGAFKSIQGKHYHSPLSDIDAILKTCKRFNKLYKEIIQTRINTLIQNKSGRLRLSIENSLYSEFWKGYPAPILVDVGTGNDIDAESDDDIDIEADDDTDEENRVYQNLPYINFHSGPPSSATQTAIDVEKQTRKLILNNLSENPSITSKTNTTFPSDEKMQLISAHRETFKPLPSSRLGGDLSLKLILTISIFTSSLLRLTFFEINGPTHNPCSYSYPNYHNIHIENLLKGITALTLLIISSKDLLTHLNFYKKNLTTTWPEGNLAFFNTEALGDKIEKFEDRIDEIDNERNETEDDPENPPAPPTPPSDESHIKLD